jgi:hypothetical protein
MSAAPAVTAQDLELETAELLPARETLFLPPWGPNGPDPVNPGGPYYPAYPGGHLDPGGPDYAWGIPVYE